MNKKKKPNKKDKLFVEQWSWFFNDNFCEYKNDLSFRQ